MSASHRQIFRPSAYGTARAGPDLVAPTVGLVQPMHGAGVGLAHAAQQRHSVGHDLHLAHVLALEPKVLKSPASGPRWFKSAQVKDKLLVLPRSSLLRLGPETGERTRARDELARARGRALRSGRIHTCAAGVAR